MVRRHPAEWEPHSACWLAFPRLPEEWPHVFKEVCLEWSALCHAIADPDPQTGQCRGEKLEILVYDDRVKATAKEYLKGLPVRFHHLPYDDIWLRDTGPVFMEESQDLLALDFDFNVWGNKYDFPNDKLTANAIAKAIGIPTEQSPLVVEGGAIESDGQGTLLTTTQCLLNPNRNPSCSQSDINRDLASLGGYEKILWIDGELRNDHTDGHIDTLARFVMPGMVVVMIPADRNDPNNQVLTSIADQLSSMKDAKGRSLQLVTIPSPGAVFGKDGEILPASYLNFYIGRHVVIVPTYGSPYDEDAIAKLAPCFPTRNVVGLSAKAMISGGGAFHCITKQQPCP